MKDINADTQFDENELTDYPYLGIGRKPRPGKMISEEVLEKIIGG